MPRPSNGPALSMPACSRPRSGRSPSHRLAFSALCFTPRCWRRAVSAALLSFEIAVFLAQKGSQPPVHAARFLPNDSEDQSQTGFHRIFYKYCVFLPNSTPTLSPTLSFEANNISIPAGNLIAKSRLNERIGKFIAESGDWQMLGYALYLYDSRINSDIQARGGWSQKLGFGRIQPPRQSVYHPTEPVQQSNGHQPTSGVFLPPSNRSNRPPGVNYGGQQ
jgi:hypothetical protein